MKTLIAMCLVCLMSTSFSQIRPSWHRAMDTELKGQVKSWKIYNDTTVFKEIQFSEEGDIVLGSHHNGSHIHPEGMPWHIKELYEKIVPEEERSKDNRYNSTGQALELNLKSNKNLDPLEDFSPFVRDAKSKVINRFDEEGRLLFNKLYIEQTEERAWNSLHHKNPTYEYTYEQLTFALYDYREDGQLKEFQYYHTDPFKNVRIVRNYDDHGNMIEELRYDNYNIAVGNYGDDYLQKLKNKLNHPNFDVNKTFPNYWGQGSPSKQTWKYNERNQKIEQVVFGYKKGPSFKATWEYDENGKLLKEIHHDVYHNTLRAKLVFDDHGNVVEETHYDYWAKTTHNYQIDIEYYE